MLRFIITWGRKRIQDPFTESLIKVSIRRCKLQPSEAEKKWGEEASVREARVSSVVTSSEEARGSVLTTLSMSESQGQRRFTINILVHLFTCPSLPLPLLVSSGKSSIMSTISFVS